MAWRDWDHSMSDEANYLAGISDKVTEFIDMFTDVQTFNALIQLNNVASNYRVRYNNGKYYARGFSDHECTCPIEMYNWLVDRKHNERI